MSRSAEALEWRGWPARRRPVPAFNGVYQVSNSYHQTQNYLTDEELTDYCIKAANQEVLILAYFQRNANLAFSPETIQAAVLPTAPITSVRRAITNLTQAGKLERIGSEQGQYGRPVGTWKYKQPIPEGMLF